VNSSSSPVVGSANGTRLLKHLVVVGKGDLRLVVRLLVVIPGCLTVALLLSHPLVLLHDRLGVGVLISSGLVFEHTAHSQDGLLLGGVVFLLLCVVGRLGHILAALLVGPVPLVLRIKSHSVVVHYRQWGKEEPRVS